MSPLAYLLCGRSDNLGDLKAIMDHIGVQISWYGNKLCRLIDGPADNEEEAIRLAPFCARVLLDLGAAAMIGRLDPVRVLLIRRLQVDKDYDPKKKLAAHIQWTGDVLPGDKTKPRQENLWRPETKLESGERALLSSYFDHLIWQPAFDEFLKQTDQYTDSRLVAGLHHKERGRFVDEMRGRLDQLYSRLSKSIHMEFMVPIEAGVDPRTLRETAVETVEQLVILSLVLNFSTIVAGRLDARDAVEAAQQLESEVLKDV